MSIDYAKAAKQWPTQKSNLTRAIRSGDTTKIIATTEKTLAQWDEVGSWPDDWSRWQRALDDAFNNDRAAYVSGKTDVRPDANAYDLDTITNRVRYGSDDAKG